jgi:hypothetical protein
VIDTNKITEEGDIKQETPTEDTENEKIELLDTFVAADSDGFSLDFVSKTRNVDTMRRNYLSKLAYQKVWLTPMQKPKTHETAIIFDWDDTILCTSFINPSGYYQHVELNATIMGHIKLLEQTAAK